MKNTTKIGLGILTFLPFILLLIYILYFFTFFLSSMLQLEQNGNDFSMVFLKSFSVIIVLIVVAITIKIAVMIYYIIHASNNLKNDTNTKIMWVVLLVLVSTIASIVYYFVEILPLKESNKPIGKTNE